MDQSTKMVGFIAAAWVIFITVRGELPTYLGFLLGTGSGNNTSAIGGASTTVSPQAAQAGFNAAMAMIGAM